MTAVKENLLPAVFFSDGEKPGTEAWWINISHRGVPLVVPIKNRYREIIFLWRQPPARKVKTVYIDVYSHTPHPVREAPTQMHRVKNTDVWYWRTELPENWCSSYFFVPAEVSDPPMPEDQGERRRWWSAMIDHRATADPLNPIPPHNGAWGQPLSGIYPADANWVHLEPKSALRSHSWQSRRLNNQRTVWMYRTGRDQPLPPETLPLVILLDGHYWAGQRNLFGELDLRTDRGHLPPAVYLSIDSLDPESRERELPCNSEFWLAVQEELLPQISALEAFSDKPERTLVAGQSYGGLAAVWAALRWPRRFGLAFSQSGAFWWPIANGALSRGGDTAGPRRKTRLDDWVADTFQNASRYLVRLRFLLEVGLHEPYLLEENRAVREALVQQAFSVEYREIDGGHDWLCWRRSLVDGIAALLASSF